MTLPDNGPRFKDFTLSEEPITFRIAPDDFNAVPEIPLDALVELSNFSATDGDRGAQFNRVKDFFDGVLDYESSAKMRQRMKIGTKEEPNPHPIGMRHLQPLMQWLMEVYGLRPTQPSSESDGGSSPTDGSSTDGLSDTESTS